MEGKKRIVTVFGSSRPLEGSEDFLIAYDLGRELALAGFTVCNGGYGGTMAASAKGATEAGGSTIGVTTHIFPKTANRWIEKEIRVEKFEERLFNLIRLGEAYVVLKGGTGTLLELAYVWETMNKGFLEKKPIVVVGAFWDRVVETLRAEMMWDGEGDCTNLILRATTPKEVVELIG
jgi:hypothetical protein